MTRFSPETITAVEQATDIVSLISEYIPLKRSGKDFKALCPFHNEKTPSFHVSPSKQIFKCFGCGEGGNCFGWVMSMDKLSFVEAVEMLAERAGIKIEKPAARGGASGGIDNERLLRACEWAAAEYEKYLWDDPCGAAAREYLAGRGLDESVARRFRLGFAPASRDTLVRGAGRRSKDAADVLERAGLVSRGSGGDLYDRFRARLIFPICDARGRVIAFGGRALGDDGPKYLNSPETPLFNKGISLYGVHLAKQAALQSREIFVMEGYTDVLAAFQKGVENAVATLGTALSAGHARLLRRYAEKVYLVYDADFAGEKASDRGLDIFLEEEVDAHILSLPEGFDPCDYLLKSGTEGFLRLRENAQEIFEFKVALASRRHDLATVAGASRALDEILSAVARVPPGARQDLYMARNEVLRALAERLGASERSLRDRLRKLKSRGPSEPHEGRSVAAEHPPEEKWLLETLLARPDLVEKAAAAIGPEDLTSRDLAAVLEEVYRCAVGTGDVRTSSIAGALAEAGLGSLVVSLAESGAEVGGHERRLADCTARIRKRRQRRELSELRERLLEQSRQGDREAENELLRQFQKGL